MNAFVVIFPPCGTSRADLETAVRQHVNSLEVIDVPPAVPVKTIDDAEHLPLWRWFIEP